eukprot:scpid96175/ scgid32844/ 
MMTQQRPFLNCATTDHKLHKSVCFAYMSVHGMQLLLQEFFSDIITLYIITRFIFRVQCWMLLCSVHLLFPKAPRGNQLLIRFSNAYGSPLPSVSLQHSHSALRTHTSQSPSESYHCYTILTKAGYG